MYCKKCGKEIKNDAVFCPFCGEPVDNVDIDPKNHTQTELKKQSYNQTYENQNTVFADQAPKSNRRGPIIAGCIIAVVIVFIAVGLIYSSGNGDSNQYTQGNSIAKLGSNILLSGRNTSKDGNSPSDLVFGNGDYRKDSILSITFLDDLSNVPNDAWDASNDQDGSVMVWVEPDSDNRYDLYLAGDGGVYANPDSFCQFSQYSSLETINFNDCFYTNKVTNMLSMFTQCTSLKYLDVSGWDTSNVTIMRNMFGDCESMQYLDLSEWDTSQVTDMSNMFQGCSSLTSLYTEGWDTSQVTDMNKMFMACSSLKELDLSEWDTSNVTNMSGMFSKCDTLTSLNVNGWDTSNVTVMSGMFYECSSLVSLDISGWDTSQVTDATDMFTGTKWEDTESANENEGGAANVGKNKIDITSASKIEYDNGTSIQGPYFVTDLYEDKDCIGFIVDNNSGYDLDLSLTLNYYDSTGELLGESEKMSESYVGNGESCFLYTKYDSNPNIAYVATKDFSGQESRQESASDSLTVKSYKEGTGNDDNLLIFNVRNDSKKTLYNPKITILYYKDNDFVAVDESYCIPEDYNNDVEMFEMDSGESGKFIAYHPVDFNVDDYEWALFKSAYWLD